MSANLNIFEQLNNDSEGEDFIGVIKIDNPSKFSEAFSSESITGKNIFETLNEVEEDRKYNFLETARDIGEQVLSKGISGAAGAYGNIAETIGLQPKEGQELPGKQARTQIEFDILSKLNRGEVPTLSEFMLLSDESDRPDFSRLATPKEIQKVIESATGIGEGKTPIGRVAGRGAEFLGEGAATGGGLKALASLGASGVAGQIIREAGGPEGLATGVEIGGAIVPSVIQGKVIPSGTSAKQIAEAGRKIGLSEAQITPLVQGEKKVAALSKVARKGTKTKELFASIKEKLGDSYNSIKGRAEAKVKLPNSEQIGLEKEFGKIRNELSKTLAPSPDKEAALNYIEKSLSTLRDSNISPEYLVNFWQDINKSVKWNSIQGGKKALAQLKEPISQTLKKVSPQLAEDFELTNQLYTKYSQISKKLKPDIVDAFINKGEILAAGPAAIALVKGNPWALGALASESALRILGREMLINPYFQNISKKLVKNFNQSSAKGVTEMVKQAREYMERKHPNEKWEFLTQE